MSVIELKLEDDSTALLQESNQPLQETVHEIVVLELYCRGSVSSGKAAQLLNTSRWAFIQYASRLAISFYDMTDDEWDSENKAAQTNLIKSDAPYVNPIALI